jgi:hypothetical protein
LQSRACLRRVPRVEVQKNSCARDLTVTEGELEHGLHAAVEAALKQSVGLPRSRALR